MILKTVPRPPIALEIAAQFGSSVEVAGGIMNEIATREISISSFIPTSEGVQHGFLACGGRVKHVANV